VTKRQWSWRRKAATDKLVEKIVKHDSWPIHWIGQLSCLTIFSIFAWNRDTAVPAEGNGDLQTLICLLVATPWRCLTLSNPVPWQNWMVAYLGYTLRMKTLFHGWPVMVHDTHTRRRSGADGLTGWTVISLSVSHPSAFTDIVSSVSA